MGGVFITDDDVVLCGSCVVPSDLVSLVDDVGGRIRPVLCGRCGVVAIDGSLGKHGPPRPRYRPVSYPPLRRMRDEPGYWEREVRTQYRRRAASKGVPSTLDDAEFGALFRSVCHYCGLPPGNRTHDFTYSGIDRIDPTLGYVFGNVLPCCIRCNKAELDTPYEEFLRWIDRVYATLHRRDMP